MPGRNLSRSLLLDISERARDLLALADGPRHLPVLEAQTPSRPHLPELRISTQHFIDMGLLPETAERLLISFLKSVARYRLTLEVFVGRATQGCRHLSPAYYHDTSVILYKRTVQSWESQIVSSVQVWLRQTGVFSADLRRQCMDIRVDDVAKVEILSRLGRKNGLRHGNCENLFSRLEMDRKDASYDKSIKPHCTLQTLLPISSAEAASKYRDFFSPRTTSSCFPSRYPLPHSDQSSSPPTPLVTSFAFKSPSRNEKPITDSRAVDMSFLIGCFSRMAITSFNVRPETHVSHKDSWAPKTKETAFLSPPLSPGIPGFSNEPCLPKATVSPAKASTTPRKRKIAGLPTRRTKAPTPSTINVSEPSIVATSPNNLTSHGSTRTTTKAGAPEVASLEHPIVSPTTCCGLLLHVRSTEKSVPNSLALTQRRARRPRKGFSLPRAAVPSSCQASIQIQFGWNTVSHRISRTPPLISDASSYTDSSSPSSDELDTPPSTPSFSQSLCASDASTSSRSKSAIPRLSPLLEEARLRSPKQGSVHVNFAKYDAGGIERPFTFTSVA